MRHLRFTSLAAADSPEAESCDGLEVRATVERLDSRSQRRHAMGLFVACQVDRALAL